MLDELIAIVNERDFDSGILRSVSVNKQKDGLRFVFTTTPLMSDADAQRWEIRCRHPFKHNVEFGSFYDLSITSKHVLLWEYAEPKIAVSFSGGTSQNAHSVVGKLYEAHQKLCGNWISFGRFLNMSDRVNNLISGGCGQLGEGPEPLMLAYENILKANGFQTKNQMLLSRYTEEEFGRLRVLIFGTSFVIATDFTSKRLL